HIAEEEGVSREDVDSTPLLNQEYTQKAYTALRNQGYHIETTIDKTIYDTMQNVKNNYNYYYGNRSIQEAEDATEEEQKERKQEAYSALLKQWYHIETKSHKTMYATMQNVKNNSNYYYGNRSIQEAEDATEEEQQESNQEFEHEIGAVLKDNASGKILGFVGGR